MSAHQHNTYHFDYLSPSATVHVINHNLNDLQPQIIVIRDDTNEQLIPSSVVITNPNTVTINLFIARTVRGKVTHGRIQP